MSIYRELDYNRVVSPIRGVQFFVMSEQAIRRHSAVEITENQTFAGNEPVPNGLFDTRMGVIDGNRVCETCKQRNTFCPGHFGHIVLERPVFYIHFSTSCASSSNACASAAAASWWTSRALRCGPCCRASSVDNGDETR